MTPYPSCAAWVTAGKGQLFPLINTMFLPPAFADNRCEVISVTTDAIWRAFVETGDPVYYLLYKTAEDSKALKDKKDKPGKKPRR